MFLYLLSNRAPCWPLGASPSLLLPPADDAWISAATPLRLHHIVAVMACFGFLLGWIFFFLLVVIVVFCFCCIGWFPLLSDTTWRIPGSRSSSPLCSGKASGNNQSSSDSRCSPAVAVARRLKGLVFPSQFETSRSLKAFGSVFSPCKSFLCSLEWSVIVLFTSHNDWSAQAVRFILFKGLFQYSSNIHATFGSHLHHVLELGEVRRCDFNHP